MAKFNTFIQKNCHLQPLSIPYFYKPYKSVRFFARWHLVPIFSWNETFSCRFEVLLDLGPWIRPYRLNWEKIASLWLLVFWSILFQNYNRCIFNLIYFQHKNYYSLPEKHSSLYLRVIILKKNILKWKIAKNIPKTTPPSSFKTSK